MNAIGKWRASREAALKAAREAEKLKPSNATGEGFEVGIREDGGATFSFVRGGGNDSHVVLSEKQLSVLRFWVNQTFGESPIPAENLAIAAKSIEELRRLCEAVAERFQGDIGGPPEAPEGVVDVTLRLLGELSDRRKSSLEPEPSSASIEPAPPVPATA